jgi:hypothetical protein
MILCNDSQFSSCILGRKRAEPGTHEPHAPDLPLTEVQAQPESRTEKA